MPQLLVVRVQTKILFVCGRFRFVFYSKLPFRVPPFFCLETEKVLEHEAHAKHQLTRF